MTRPTDPCSRCGAPTVIPTDLNGIEIVDGRIVCIDCLSPEELRVAILARGDPDHYRRKLLEAAGIYLDTD